MEQSIINEACNIDECFDFTDEDWFDEYIEDKFNTYLVDIPKISLDWIEILNYVNEFEMYIQFPVNKTLLYNQYRYAVVNKNREEIMDSIKKFRGSTSF